MKTLDYNLSPIRCSGAYLLMIEALTNGQAIAEAADEDASDAAIKQEMCDRLELALTQLSKRERAVIELILDGVSYTEIGKRLDCPVWLIYWAESTAKRTLTRLLQQ